MNTQDKEVERMFMQKVDEDCFVDISQVIEHPPVALSFGNYSLNTPNGIRRYPIPIGTYGNFSFVSAPPKTKKTFFVSLLTSVYLSSTGKNKYGGKLRAKRDDKCVIHFDTEQGKFHAQRVFRRVVEMNGNENSGCYHTYGLRSIGYKTRIDFIDYKLRTISEENEIGLVVIDGIADLVSDVNSIEESNECIQRLMTWSEKYNCHIILCIHTNNGSEKPTGHLGSFAQKKCETGIILEKNEQDDGIVTVKCKQSRGFSFESFSFKVTEFGYPEIISNLDEDLGEAILPKKRTKRMATKNEYRIVTPMYIELERKTKKNRRVSINMNSYGHSNHFTNNEVKIKFKQVVGEQLKGITIETPVNITYQVFKPSKRRLDKMNVIAVTSKYLLDAITELGCWEDDNDDYVKIEKLLPTEYDKGNGRVEILIKTIDDRRTIK